VEFLRTAEQLERSRDARAAEAMSHINACEKVIPVENQALMTSPVTRGPLGCA
jgi:hypothetical protein